MKIDTALRQAIERSGKSMNQIAHESGVPFPVIQRFVKGVRPNLLLDTVQRLFDYFRIEVKLP